VRDQKVARINAVSPSFCLAKWLQVTVDLTRGTTQSCHHPKRHDIPLSEIAVNPSALHNTNFKKEQRRKMLAGERPPECSYCWAVEDAPAGLLSDRYIKSMDPWAYGELDRISQLPWDTDVAPTYLEVMIDDRCHFSCMYCLADISTSVALEMEKHGAYRVKDSAHRMPQSPKIEGDNPYVKAFHEWLPRILPGLHTLRLTGGEPLLSPRLEETLSIIENNPSPRLILTVNTNLGHRGEKIDRFIDRVLAMRERGSIGSFEIYTSMDTAGARADYIRYGMSHALVLENIERIALRPERVPVVIMATYNLLSISSFDSLLADVLDLKRRGAPVVLDTSHLVNPSYLRASLAGERLREKLVKSVAFMQSATEPGFSAHETQKLINVLGWVDSQRAHPEGLSTIESDRADFFSFITEYDRRKGTDFHQLFPEYRGFWMECKTAYFNRIK
jgi:organic radical activating enzyme